MDTLKKLLVLSTVVSLLCVSSVTAGHFMTGSFEWEALGNDSFKVTVYTYRDCDGVSASAPTIKVSSSCSTYTVSSSSGLANDVTPVCSGQCSRCTSSSCSFSWGAESVSFSAVIGLANERKNSCCLVSLSISECCRSSPMTGGSKEPWYIEAKINPCIVPNSSVKWSGSGPVLVCTGRDQQIDVSIITDSPNDSIVYSLTSPLRSSGKSITWSSGYDKKRPLTYLGYPNTNLTTPRGFNLDTAKGLLNFRPTQQEVAVMATAADVYRNGVFLGRVHRESRLIVMKCPQNSTPVLSGVDCKKSSVKNLKMEVCPGTELCFKICSSDGDTDDSLSLEWNKGIPGASFTVLNPSDKNPTGEFCWTPKSSDISDQPHRMVVTVYDDACPVNGVSSQVYNITVKRPDSAQVSLYTTDLGCNTYRFRLESVNNVVPNTVNWYVSDSILIGSGDSIEHQFDSIGTFVVSGVNNGCYQQILKDTIKVDAVGNIEVNDIDIFSYFCANQMLKIRPKVIGAVGPLVYSWNADTGVKFESSRSADSLDAVFPVSSAEKLYGFELIVTDSLKCSLETKFEVVAMPPKIEHVDGDYNICSGASSTLILKQYNGRGNWVGPSVDDNEMNLDALSTGQHVAYFTYADSNGCVFDSSIVRLKPSPDTDAGDDLSSCTSGLLTKLGGTPSGGTWTGTGVNSNNELEPYNLSKGKYTLTYSYTNSDVCTDVDSINLVIFDYELSATAPDSAFSCHDGPSFNLVGTPTGGFWRGAGYVSSGSSVQIDPSQVIPGGQNLVYTAVDTNGCTGRDTTIMVIEDLPMASFKMRDSLVEQGDTLSIQNTSQIRSLNTSFQWTISQPTNKVSNGVLPRVKMDSLGYHDIELIVTDTLTGCSDTTVQKRAVRVIKTTSLGSTSLQNVKVFPNPTASKLYVVSSLDQQISVNLISLNGKVIEQVEQLNGQITFDFSHLPNGVYALKLSNGEAVEVRRVVKE